MVTPNLEALRRRVRSGQAGRVIAPGGGSAVEPVATTPAAVAPQGSGAGWFYIGLAIVAVIIGLAAVGGPTKQPVKSERNVAAGKSTEVNTARERAKAPPAEVERVRAAEAEAQRQAALQVQERARAKAEAERRARNSLSFSVSNTYGERAWVGFYTGDRRKAWPGGGQYYVLKSGETGRYDLSCTYAEQVCFAAWADGGALSASWGGGYKGQTGCSDCCYSCGGGSSGTIVLSRANSHRPPPSKTFKVMSDSWSRVIVAFYSKSRRRAWPGGDTAGSINGYRLEKGKVMSFRLGCRRGERICYGAWLHQNVGSGYWGCGPGCRRGCSDCCYECDGEETPVIRLGR